ncbi:MAG: hypothetical protein ACTSV2_13060 [Candidatus Thorarchaeota archaeon]
MSKGNRTPNDDRSDSKNPNNPAHEASEDNRADQLNPDHEAYHASRGSDEEDEEEDP